ncbi:aminoacyl-tRNA hydrolase [bacterium]|nr:aminoacyl-tRNA hydrolase [bacterium]
MLLIVGLGNPGKEYEATRHNAGFMAVDALADKYGFAEWRSKFKGHMAEGSIGGVKTLLLKPQTFMNRSGISVVEAAGFYKIPPEKIMAIHDELDLPAGRMKTKLGGTPAGHNGLKDMDRVLGQGYWRVRLGIGHPGRREMVHGHVLSDFDKAERVALDDAIAKLCEVMPEWQEKPERFVEHINGFASAELKVKG